MTVELEEIDFCTPTAWGFTEGGREMEIDEAAEPGMVLFSTRWFTLNGEGARRETADLGEVCGVLRTLMLALEFILALGRMTGDGEGTLLGDGGRLETAGRDEIPFTLRGEGGRSRSSLVVTFAFTVVMNRGRGGMRPGDRSERSWWLRGSEV